MIFFNRRRENFLRRRGEFGTAAKSVLLRRREAMSPLVILASLQLSSVAERRAFSRAGLGPDKLNICRREATAVGFARGCKSLCLEAAGASRLEVRFTLSVETFFGFRQRVYLRSDSSGSGAAVS